MAGLAHPLRLVLLAAIFEAVGRAQTSAPAAPAAAAPPVSPKLARLFGGNPPKYQPPQPADATSAPIGSEDQPRNEIIRLPRFIVRNARPPTEEDVQTEAGREAAMAQRYLGPQGNLDRALNSVTLAGLWKSIPILGRIPFVPFGSLTYDQRAALIYENVEKRRRFAELMDIEMFAQKVEKARPVAKSQPAEKPIK